MDTSPRTVYNETYTYTYITVNATTPFKREFLDQEPKIVLELTSPLGALTYRFQVIYSGTYNYCNFDKTGPVIFNQDVKLIELFTPDITYETIAVTYKVTYRSSNVYDLTISIDIDEYYPFFCSSSTNIPKWQCSDRILNVYPYCNVANPTEKCITSICTNPNIYPPNNIYRKCYPFSYCANTSDSSSKWQCNEPIVSIRGCNQEIPTEGCILNVCSLDPSSIPIELSLRCNYCGVEENADKWQCNQLIVNYPGCNQAEPTDACKDEACNQGIVDPSLESYCNYCAKGNNSTTKWQCQPQLVNHPGCNRSQPTNLCKDYACSIQDSITIPIEMQEYCGYCELPSNINKWQCQYGDLPGCSSNEPTNECKDEVCALGSIIPIPTELEPYCNYCSNNVSEWQCNEKIVNIEGCNRADPSTYCIQMACYNLDPSEMPSNIYSNCNPTSSTVNISIGFDTLLMILLVVFVCVGIGVTITRRKNKSRNSKPTASNYS